MKISAKGREYRQAVAEQVRGFKWQKWAMQAVLACWSSIRTKRTADADNILKKPAGQQQKPGCGLTTHRLMTRQSSPQGSGGMVRVQVWTRGDSKNLEPHPDLCPKPNCRSGCLARKRGSSVETTGESTREELTSIPDRFKAQVALLKSRLRID